MKKIADTELHSWWKIKFPNDIPSEVFTDLLATIGGCDRAEHNFLKFFLVLKYLVEENVGENIVLPLIKTVNIYSLNLEKSITAKAIKKEPIRTSVKINQKKQLFQYRFGVQTYLVLSGQFAGAICTINHDVKKQRTLGENEIPLMLNRPIGQCSKGVIRATNHTIRTTSPDKPDLDVLQKIVSILEKTEYTPALLSILKELKIPIDTQQIIENSKMLPDNS